MKSFLRCEFEWVKITDSIVFIRDLNQGKMSVTNDAEEVYRWINRVAYPGRRVVYQDSEGEWTEIVGAGPYNIQIGFRPWYGEVWDQLTKVES